jgi:thioredoxin reductase (NADPH)
MTEHKTQHENSPHFDVVIIGGGAAGMSAAAWCDELSLKTLLLESGAELGGQLLRIYNPVKNHLGANAETGRELRDIFVNQIQARGFMLRLQCMAAAVDTENKLLILEDGESFSAKAIIVATGVRRRRLNVPGESEFQNRGILESGKRDKDLAAGKRVYIAGGGDAALENALILSETASQITLVHRRKDFRARSEFLEKVRANPKIKILTDTIITKISGKNAVEAVELKNLLNGEIFTLPTEAILLRVGVEPNTEFVRGKLKLDKNGYVKINAHCETSVENIFAVGDVASPLSPTVSSAVGTGATAAKVIFSKLNRQS